MTAIEQLNGLRGQFTGMRPLPGDALGALGKLSALVTVLNQVKAVPSPPGDPGWTGAYAASLSTMADTWDDINDNLTTSRNALLAAWSGVTAEDAAALINGMGRDVDDLVEAFRAAAAALDNWAEELSAAQNLDAQTLDRLNGTHEQLSLFDEISSIQHSAGQVIIDDVFSDRQDKSQAALDADAANQEYGRTSQVWTDAEQIISQRITAAQNAWNGANEVATTLNNLASHGLPVGPNGQRITGASDLLSALTTALPTPDGTAPGDAAAAAALITLANSGQPLTPGEKAQLQGILAKEDTNPEFATDLLNDIGPTGFLQFASDPGSPELYHDAVLVLSAASGVTPGQPHLSDDWMERLKTTADGNSADYALLGDLIAGDTGDPVPFGADFLTKVGDDMVSYEISHGGSSKAWGTEIVGRSTTTGQTVRYQDPRADPVYQLMIALHNNPAAATEFLSQINSQVQGLPVGHDPSGAYAMTDYLLDRQWTEDQGSDPLYFDPNANPELYKNSVVVTAASHPGMTALGWALEAGTANPGPPGTPQFNLAGHLYTVLGSTEMPKLTQGLGPGATQMTVNYINDGYINDAMVSDPYHRLAPGVNVAQTLLTLGQDPDQYKAITTAEFGYTDAVIAAATNYDMGSQTQRTIQGSGRVMALLAHGQYNGTVLTAQMEDMKHNNPEWLKTFNQIAGYADGSISNGGALPTKILDQARAAAFSGSAMGVVATAATGLIANAMVSPQNTVPGVQGQAAWQLGQEQLAATSISTKIYNPLLDDNDRSNIANDLGAYFVQD